MHSPNIWRAVDRKLRAGALIALALALGSGAGTWAQDPNLQNARVALPYNQDVVARLLQNARFLGHQNPQTPVNLDFMLPLRNQSQLQTLLTQLYDKNDPHYHHYLTPAQFTAQFGPTEEDYNTVRSYAESEGFKIVNTTPSRTLLTVSGSTDAVENAFGLRINRYLMSDGHVSYAASGLPSVPRWVADRVTGVVGLSNVTYRHHHHSTRNALDQELMEINSHVGGHGPAGGFAPIDVTTAYNVPTTLQGQGEAVALYELDGYQISDIDTFATYYGTPAPSIKNVYIDGYDGSIQDPTFQGESEVVLDLDMVLAMAPKIGTIYYYGAVNGTAGELDEYAKIANDDLASVVSTSWGVGEDVIGQTEATAESAIFQQMATQGQTIFDASGDAGAFDDTNKPTTAVVDDPAGQPMVTGVGGTTLTLSSTGGYGSETAWSGSGGGLSTIWPTPTYQKPVEGTNTFRQVPDVALNADNNTGYDIFVTDAGGWFTVGGTSAAAPLWAGFTALVDQQLSVSGLTSVGFINPNLYAIGGSTTEYPADFNDITTNDVATGNGKFTAVKGYDEVTGWGTINGAGLFQQLAIPSGSVLATVSGMVTDSSGNPITVIPTGGTTAVGGVTVTAYIASSNQVAGSTTTDTTGKYSLSLENAFTYTITFTAAGYVATSLTNVTIPAAGLSEATIELAASPHTFPAAGWQMVSLPQDFTNVADFSQIFGLVDDPPLSSDPSLYIWEPTQNGYAQTPSSPADTFHLGDGYWIYLTQAESISRQGITSTAPNFYILLSPGWNMIGDPYGSSVPLSSIGIAPTSSPTSIVPFGQSAAVKQIVYTYPAGGGADASGYNELTVTDKSTIDPYAGYWVYAVSGCDLVIPQPSS